MITSVDNKKAKVMDMDLQSILLSENIVESINKNFEYLLQII